MVRKDDDLTKIYNKSVAEPQVEPRSLTVNQVFFQLHHILQMGKAFVKFTLILAPIICVCVCVCVYLHILSTGLKFTNQCFFCGIM